MNYKITKLYSGNIEFAYGDNLILLTELNPSVVLTKEEYDSVPKTKIDLIDSQLLVVEFVEEEIKKEVKKNK